MDRQLGTASVSNFWIQDGYKDLPEDRKGPRERLAASLDAIFAAPLSPRQVLDAVESKLFSLGSESHHLKNTRSQRAAPSTERSSA